MQSGKRQNLLLPVIYLFILFLVGCIHIEFSKNVNLDGKSVVDVTISKVGETMQDIKKPHISYNQEDSQELQTIVEAIKKADKVNGVVDVAAADYLLTLTFEDKVTSKYYLWLGDDGGSIMNEKDSHTMYTLPKRLIEELIQIVG